MHKCNHSWPIKFSGLMRDKLNKICNASTLVVHNTVLRLLSAVCFSIVIRQINVDFRKETLHHYFNTAVTKYLTRSSSKEKGFVLAHGSRVRLTVGVRTASC